MARARLPLGIFLAFVGAAPAIPRAEADGGPQPLADPLGRPVPALIVADGAPIRPRPDERSRPSRRGRFGELYYLSDLLRSAGTVAWCRLAAVPPHDGRDADPAGWAKAEHCLLRHKALRAERNALVLAVPAAASVAVRAGPGSDHSSIGELQLLGFYYVYAREGHGNDEWWLLGRQPALSPAGRAPHALVGWARGERLVEWTSRQAVQFARVPERRRPARLWASRAGAEAEVRGTPPEREVLAEEVVASPGWPPGRGRFPVLETRSARGPEGWSRLFRVLFVADVPAAPAVEAPQTIDLLLAIDATGSMAERMPSVASSVERTLAAARDALRRAGAPPRLRIHVAFYRDYHDGELAIRLLPPTDRVEEATALIRGEPVKLGQGAPADNPRELAEAPFYGLCTALDRAPFLPRSFRLVVLIADRGNHQPDPRGCTERHVVDALTRAEASLLAVHVAPRAEFDVDAASRRFKEQMGRIVEGLKHRGEGLLFGAYCCQPKPEPLGELIALGAIEATRSRRLAAAARRPGADALRWGVRLAGRDHPPEALPLAATGWLAEHNPGSGRRQAEVVTLLRREEVETVAAILHVFAARPVPPRALRDAWKRVLEGRLRTAADDRLPVAEIIAQGLGIPVREPLLRRSLVELSRLDEQELTRLQEKLAASRDRLRSLLGRDASGPWFQVAGLDYAWLRAEELP
ncbi:MAG: hypothetical protein ACLF0G_07685 [Candidatus Brocadiia bacterium]